MNGEGDNSDSGDPQTSIQSSAKLRAALKKSMTKCTALRAELDKSIENTNVLGDAVRQRAELILQLSTEKQQFAAQIEILQERLQEKDRQFEEMAKILEEKDEKIENLSTTPSLLINQFNEDRGHLSQRLTAANGELSKLKSTEADLESEKSKTLSLQAELDTIRITLADRESELLQLKRSIIIDRDSATSILLSLSPSLPSHEPSEDHSPIQLLRDTIRQLQEELQLYKNRPNAEEIRIHNQEKSQFAALRDRVVHDLEDKREALKKERMALEAVRSEVNTAKFSLAKEREAFDEELSYHRRDRRTFETELSSLEAQRAALEELVQKEASEERKLFQRQNEFERKRQEIEKKQGEIEKKREEIERTAADLAQREQKLAAERGKLKAAEIVTVENSKKQFEAMLQKEREDHRALAEEQRAIIAKLKAQRAKEAKETENTVGSAYLKKVCLQFFVQEPSARGSLIPVLLNLVGCSDVEIQIAVRKWNESFQFFPRVFWPFP
jgi:chromosome segregation ATPase